MNPHTYNILDVRGNSGIFEVLALFLFFVFSNVVV